MVAICISAVNAQWTAMNSGLEIEHVTPHSGEDIRLRLGMYTFGATGLPYSQGEGHISLCYDTGSADFPLTNGTFDAFLISKKTTSIFRIRFPILPQTIILNLVFQYHCCLLLFQRENESSIKYSRNQFYAHFVFGFMRQIFRSLICASYHSLESS